MFIALFAVIATLVLGHVAAPLAAAVRQFGWYGTWIGWLDAQFPHGDAWRGRFGISIALAAPLLAALLLQVALNAPYVDVVKLLFGIAVLFYCWGPRDLDLDIEAVVDAPDALAQRAAAAELWPEAPPGAVCDGPALTGAVFDGARLRWFGVLFWFLLLGAFGALLYRLVALSAQGGIAQRLPADNRAGAQWLLRLLDWPVAQLMAGSLALVGNFDAVFNAWRDNGGASFDLHARFLAAAGRASVRSELADEAQDDIEDGVSGSTALALQLGEFPELRDAMSLVWRALLVWLAVIALFVVAGWVS